MKKEGIYNKMGKSSFRSKRFDWKPKIYNLTALPNHQKRKEGSSITIYSTIIVFQRVGKRPQRITTNCTFVIYRKHVGNKFTEGTYTYNIEIIAQREMI